MKKIIVFLMGIFLLVGCSNIDSTNTRNNTAMANYSTTDLIVGTIVATALYNNYGVSTIPGYGVGVGESKVKSHTNEVSNSHITRSVGSDGSINTRTVTHTTTKTKSKGMSYGIGF